MRIQDLLADDTAKALGELRQAFLRLPEDKRSWSPGGDARTAINMMAECAILGDQSNLFREKRMPADFTFEKYMAAKDHLAQDWPKLDELLCANVAKTVDAIRAVPDSELTETVDLPWGPMPMVAVMGYAAWNMTYHLGQINYLLSMHGLLE